MVEVFDLVDKNDNVIGIADRDEVHGNPDMIHRVAHVLVFNSAGELYLQKRSADKMVQPGKWDTSVGGHVDAGETYDSAAVRETAEELGISTAIASFDFLYKYLHRNDFESEWVTTYRIVWDGSLKIQESEIDDGRFWSLEEIESSDKSIFTPNFLDELGRYRGFTQAL
ncbi:MAG: NUDIX domain-containing protein [Spirochaetales bacterium]|uniref:NUDIX domain-containing protein n=1 Tax=Candidatus Thalassospirochaeta sargassi TaxID=3119039 RepID=A0AAJ1IHK0_9SPIO|nr:NUDIX domain-containing protein [Spirochaetales bacterium]